MAAELRLVLSARLSPLESIYYSHLELKRLVLCRPAQKVGLLSLGGSRGELFLKRLCLTKEANMSGWVAAYGEPLMISRV